MGSSEEDIQDILHSFRKVTWALYHLFREEAKDHDITFVQLFVLRVLSKKNQLGLNELSQELLLSNSTMSGVIERLVTAGLVVRERSEKDRRTIFVRLTEKGRNIEKAAFGENAVLTHKLNSLLEIPLEDRKHLLKTHEIILEKLQLGEGKDTR
ncbi:MAG: MarR family winged helix-turn-helix transcriptional regulator [Tuberibacillus sp.]